MPTDYNPVKWPTIALAAILVLMTVVTVYHVIKLQIEKRRIGPKKKVSIPDIRFSCPFCHSNDTILSALVLTIKCENCGASGYHLIERAKIVTYSTAGEVSVVEPSCFAFKWTSPDNQIPPLMRDSIKKEIVVQYEKHRARLRRDLADDIVNTDYI